MNKLTLIDKAFFLKKTLLFDMLDLDLLLAIAEKMQALSFNAESVIFGPDEEAFRMYFITEGDVEICDPNGELLRVLHPGEFFGDESMFNERPRAYQATSQTDCILLALSRTNLLNIISECPSVAVGLLQTYALGMQFRPRKQD